MNTTRVFNRQTGIIAVAVALLLTTLISALVSAAQVTQRSVELSSSSVNATGVAYTIGFTSVEAAGAVVVDFCSNSPLIGEVCTPPAGFKVDTAVAANGFTTDTLTTVEDNKILVTGTVAEATAISIPLTNVTNPTVAGPLYARVLTFTDSAAAKSYTSLVPGAHKDQGGMALYITPTVAISGDVLESMTFCMSAPADVETPVDPITSNCGGTLNAPVLKLGKNIGGVFALDTDDIYTGIIYTQISTNASQGAVISMKSGTPCGGLKRVDTAVCDIAPAGVVDPFVLGEAKFGLKLGANITDPTDGDLAATANYNNTAFRFNYVSDNSAGVTSTFGDQILTTNGKLANNRNMPLTFGASVANNTPAGAYSTDISLIATGKF